MRTRGCTDDAFCLVREILDVCDALRDDALPELGVRLEDIEGRVQSRGALGNAEA